MEKPQEILPGSSRSDVQCGVHSEVAPPMQRADLESLLEELADIIEDEDGLLIP
jgi:hypothetical protein